MNLEQWRRLRKGDVVHWHDDPEKAFRLVEQIHDQPRLKHRPWPKAWTLEPVDPNLTGHLANFTELSCGSREFFLKQA